MATQAWGSISGVHTSAITDDRPFLYAGALEVHE